MRLPEFITTIFTKYAPVSEETLASLKIELTNFYMKNLSTLEEKEKVNKGLQEKAETIELELQNMDEHTPEYEKKLFELEDIQDRIKNPSFLERIVAWFEHPMVRLALMVSCVFISRWVAKKLTEVKQPKEVETEEEQAQGYGQGMPYQYPPHYNPYGYGYMPPPPSSYGQERR